ncbi:ABC transporter permease [Domibacillus indicus]|uniref:ABC transporter permease n=1 Tax=Domibacillus indicus TaxID=1437523 RepID=UPI000618002C|nr:ABC transporter permease [Domibacillus indicus]
MRNSFKVAKWEVKRNIKNKSFLISLILTPVLFLVFFTVPTLFGDDEKKSTATNKVTVIIQDELGVYNEIDSIIKQQNAIHWALKQTDRTEKEMVPELETAKNTVFVSLTEEALAAGKINVWMSEGANANFLQQAAVIEPPLRALQLERAGLNSEQIEMISQRIGFKSIPVKKQAEKTEPEPTEDPMKKLVPGAFAGVVLFSIVMTGMMIFQSASQEKKEKVAEIILSSVTPADLMQGKIIGYFVLGLTQVFVWMAFVIPLIIWRFDVPIFNYLLVPELALLLFIALSGYLLFASLFVGIGATVEDISTSSNFQGMLFMLPFMPFIFIGPILSNPEGLAAQIGSYIPFTAPGVLLIRLSIMERWPWIEILIALVILTASIWLFMKLAGKVFQTGILMYGKNATPKEIWKWMWS